MHEEPQHHLYAKLERYSDAENWEAAGKCAAEILALDPEDIYAHSARATALLALERPDDALPHVEAALSLAPDDPDSHHQAAHYYLDKNKLRQAIKHIETALASEPENSDYLVLAAIIYSQKWKFKKARALAKRARECAPDDPRVVELNVLLKTTGTTITTSGKNLESIRELKTALAADPENASLHHTIGTFYLEEFEDARSAEEHFRNAVRISPKEKSYQHSLFESVAARNIFYSVLSLPQKFRKHFKGMRDTVANRPIWLLWYLICIKFIFFFFCWFLLVTLAFQLPAKLYEWLVVSVPKKGAATPATSLRIWFHIRRWPAWFRGLSTVALTLGYWVALGLPFGGNPKLTLAVFGIFYTVHFILVACLIFGKRLLFSSRNEIPPT